MRRKAGRGCRRRQPSKGSFTNVREWVLDRYYNKYDVAAPATGERVEQPLAPNASTVARGGFWESEAAAIRVSPSISPGGPIARTHRSDSGLQAIIVEVVTGT